MTLFTWIRQTLIRTFPPTPTKPIGTLFRVSAARIAQLQIIQVRTGAKSEAQVINDALTAWNYITKKN
jgi:hypothetical protein